MKRLLICVSPDGGEIIITIDGFPPPPEDGKTVSGHGLPPSFKNLCFTSNDPERLYNIVQCLADCFKPYQNGISPVSLTTHYSYIVIYYMFTVFGIIKKGTKVPTFLNQLDCCQVCGDHLTGNKTNLQKSIDQEAKSWKQGRTFVDYLDIGEHLDRSIKSARKVRERMERLRSMENLMRQHHLIE